MVDIVEIYGAKVRLPNKPEASLIYNSGKHKKDQKFVRAELPEYFETVEFNKDGDLILTEQQEQYAGEEVRRCKKGLWIWIGGTLRFITGKYYFFLQYYVLEDGTVPEFREADRLFYIFHEYWFGIDWCLGNIRIKKRRQGASSQSCSNLLYEAIFFKNSNCGLISKTKEDSQDTFTQMVTAAYRELPVYLKPKQVNKEDSVTKLVFAHKAQNIREGVASAISKKEGNNSTINFKAPVLNAYDRGRMSYVLGDEFGKYAKDVPVNQLLSIISKTLVKGVKRVGWIDMPSTTNEMTKGGGDEYKKIWDKANQFKRKPTINRIVRFFQPAYEAYEGFIDEYGDSVIGKPTKEQYDYLVKRWVKYNEDGEQTSELNEEDISLGAKVYVMEKRREGLSGIDLEEEIRMNPCSEEEAFMYAGQGCEFNSVNIQKQIKDCEADPSYWRSMRLVQKKEVTKSVYQGEPDIEKLTVSPMDDEKGGWRILEYPNKQNLVEQYGDGYYAPLNRNLYQIGVDTTQDDRIAANGSNPAIIVFKKSCIITIDGERVETGMYPVAIWDSPTRMDIHFDEEVLKACMWYGCTAAYEIDKRTDFVRYFRSKNCADFLEWTPKVMMNPVKKKLPEPGQRSGDPFQLIQMLQIAKWYVDGDSMVEYNGHVQRIKYVPLLKQLLKYDHSDRTESDLVVALQMALCAVYGDIKAPVIPAQVINIFPEHKIKSYF